MQSEHMFEISFRPKEPFSSRENRHDAKTGSTEVVSVIPVSARNLNGGLDATALLHFQVNEPDSKSKFNYLLYF